MQQLQWACTYGKIYFIYSKQREELEKSVFDKMTSLETSDSLS